jgi:transglutaminase-like putative cysteine protease
MASRARIFAPIALGALSVAAALSLGRVFDSARYVGPVVGAALAPHALGVVTRRYGRAIPTAFTAPVGLVVYVVLTLEWSTTWYGIPRGATWHAVVHQLDTGWTLLRTAPAPAAVTNGALLLAVIATWVMATIADTIAFRRQAALASVTPALVLFVWSATLGTTQYRVETTAGFAAAAVVFLLVQNLAVIDQRRSWLVSRHPGRPHVLAPAALLGVGAIVVGLVVAPLLPGADSDPLVDFRNPGRDRAGGHTYRTAVAPLVDVGAKLQRSAEKEVFTVRSGGVPDYWRIAALDQYTGAGGGQWTLSAEGNQVRVGLSGTVPSGALRQEYRIGALTERWMPAAYRPVAVSRSDTLVVTASSTLVTDADAVTGLRYTVDSALAPTPGSVTAAQVAATVAAVPRSLRQYATLPPGFPASVVALARSIVAEANAHTPYDEARALRDYFRSGAFVYDTNVPAVDDANAIVDFLQTKRGFCVQFAATYALMARALHLPARVAVGYTPGELRDGVFHVTTHDAHAWPEVWLAGLGWTHLFDPTPAKETGATGGSELPGEGAVATPVVPSTAPPTTAPSTSATGGVATTAPAPRPSVTTATPGGSHVWLAVVLGVLAVLALVAAYVGGVLGAKSRRRKRRREAPDTADAVRGAWAEALDRLHEARLPSDPSLTPLELARCAPARTAPGTAAPLRALARTYTTARYADVAPGPGDAESAWAAVAQLEHALSDGLPLRERWRRRLDPSTLRAPVGSGNSRD